MVISEILHGAMVSCSLIVAIGSQNLFVIKQGLLRNHIFWVSLICSVCDFCLMTLGVLGAGEMIKQSQIATLLLAILGSIFLIGYALRSFYSAYKANSFMKIENEASMPRTLKWTVMATLAITLLNPHVYLDTVVILGGVTVKLAFDQKIMFLIGAISTSFIWFFGIGYGARLLAPYFKQKITWVILDIVVGCIMLYIAYQLIMMVFLG